MGDVQGKLTFRYHEGVVQASVDDGATWADVGGGGCASDPWGDTVAAFVATKVTTLVNVCFRSKFATGFTQEIERSAVSGTGADATMDATRNGGVLKQDSGTTGNSFRNVKPANAEAAAGLRPTFVTNARTQKWAVAARVIIGTVGAGAALSPVFMGDLSTAEVGLGVRGGTSTANWSLAVTGQATQNTGVALPTAAFATVAVIADGTNVTAWNVDTGAQIGTPAAQVNVAAVAMFPFNNALNTAAASNTFFMDDWMCVTEPAA